MRDPIVIDSRFGSVRICVPASWTDLQALEFVEDSVPCGARSGWKVRGERKTCADDQDMIHLVVGL